MRKYERPIISTSAFINKKGKYLLTFDPKFGFWRVPGGRPDFGEKAEDALKREMKEELNIEIEVTKFLGFGQDVVTFTKRPVEVSRLLLFFECKIKEGKIKLMDTTEVSKIKWLSFDKIKRYQNLEPGMKDFFKRFGSH